MSRFRLVRAAAVVVAVIGAAAITNAADARTSVHIGLGFPILVAPPPYYYPPPPPAYYAPPPTPYHHCRARYDWRWTYYGWQRVYVGCW